MTLGRRLIMRLTKVILMMMIMMMKLIVKTTMTKRPGWQTMALWTRIMRLITIMLVMTVVIKMR